MEGRGTDTFNMTGGAQRLAEWLGGTNVARGNGEQAKMLADLIIVAWMTANAVFFCL